MACIRRCCLAYAVAFAMLCALLSNALAEQRDWQTVTTHGHLEVMAAERVGPPYEPSYGVATFAQQTASVALEFGVLFAGITYIGVTNWNWGNSGFRFNPEHWFGRNTGSGGTDKLGHFYTTYVMSDLLIHAIRRSFHLQDGAELTAAALALGLMFYVEVFDGRSRLLARKHDRGFARCWLLS